MWMLAFSTVLFLVNNALGQDCSGPPRYGVHPHECCPSIPRFITRESAVECGMPEGGPPPGAGGSGGPGSGGPGGPGGPRGPPCDVVKCVLNKNNLLTGDKVNRSAFKTYMESQYSGDWLPVIGKAITTCNSEVSATSTDCEPKQYMGCFKHNMFINCPSSVFQKDIDGCNQLKAHFTTCPKPPSTG